MNSIYSKIFFLIVPCWISGCAFDNQEIEDKNLRDRVAACGGGFSNEAVASLQALYLPSFIPQGDLDIQLSTKQIIFSEIPEPDRLKAYENYIRCIKSLANSNPSPIKKTKPSANRKQKNSKGENKNISVPLKQENNQL